MDEETKPIQTNADVMDRAVFEKKLTEFFTQHKKTKLRLVSRIALEFRGYENDVLEFLHNKYVLKIKKTKHIDPILAADVHLQVKQSAAVPRAKQIAPKADTKPKSKKKLFIIIGIVVVVISLGVAGFLMKDKFMAPPLVPAKKEVVTSRGKTALKAINTKNITPAAVDSILDAADSSKGKE